MLFRNRLGVASLSLVLVFALGGCKSKAKKPAADDQGQPVQVDKEKEIAADSRKAQDYLDEGTLAESSSEFVKARDLYLKAKTTYPDAGKDAAAFRARCESKLSGLEEIVVAQQDLSGAGEGKKAECEVRYADALRKRGAYEKAQAQLDDALKLNPGLASAHTSLATLRFEQGDLKGSLDCAGKGLEADKGSAEAYYQLAFLNRVAQVDGADPAKTLDYAKKAVELAPNDWKAHELLASCLKDAGQQDQAVAELVAACKASNGLPRLMKKLDVWAPGTKVDLPPPPAPPAEKPAEKPADKPADAPAEKPADKPADAPADKPADKPADAPADKPAEKPAEKPADAPADKPAEKPADAPAEKPAEKAADAPAEKPAEAPAEKKEGGM